MSRSEDPDDNSKTSGSPKNIKAETATARGHAQNSRDDRKKPPGPKIPKKITETYLHNAGLYYLQRFAASSGQFRTVMQRKIDNSCRHHVDQDRDQCLTLLNALVIKFENVGLLNDEGYARGMVISLRRRGLSERAILMRLQNKGLSEPQIRAALIEFNEENQVNASQSERQAALKLARKKRLGPYAVAEFDFNKALAAFARAGFSFDVAQNILRLTPDDLNDDPGE